MPRQTRCGDRHDHCRNTAGNDPHPAGAARGYLHNDPSCRVSGFDNMPNWEYGVLVQAAIWPVHCEKYRVARSPSQKKMLISPSPSRASIFNQKAGFCRPPRASIATHCVFSAYRARLAVTGQNSAHARADNLSHWLGMIEKRLG